MTKNTVHLPSEIESFDHKSKLGYLSLKAFFRICEDWEIGLPEQCKLLNVGLIDLQPLRTLPAQHLSREQLVRVRCLVMIYKVLMRKHGSISEARGELRSSRDEAPFKGKTPLKLMLSEGVVGIADACNALTGGAPEVSSYLSKAS